MDHSISIAFKISDVPGDFVEKTPNNHEDGHDTNQWAKDARQVWDHATEQQLDISPSPEKNFQVFVSHYAKLPDRLSINKNSQILDLGCGTGFISKICASSSCHVTGLDLSLKSLALAKQRSPQIVFVAADMTRTPFMNASFDYIFAITSLEFCHDKAKALAEVHRLLSKTGEVYCEVRNADFLPLLVASPLRGFFKFLGWLKPLPMHQFRDLSDREWLALFRQEGFVLIQKYPSLRPWNYGSLSTRIKQSLIALTRLFTPVEWHYMVGYQLRKKDSV